MNVSRQLLWMISRWPILDAASETALANKDAHLHNTPSKCISKFARLSEPHHGLQLSWTAKWWV